MDSTRTPPASVGRLARRVLSASDLLPPTAPDLSAEFERVCHGLHAELEPLLTSAAFHAVFRRALFLARRDVPLLERVTAEAAGRCSLEALRERLPRQQQSQIEDAILALMTHLVWLTIGAHLTLRALQSVRPEMTVDEARELLEGKP